MKPPSMWPHVPDNSDFLARSSKSSYLVSYKRKRKLAVNAILRDVKEYVDEAEARIGCEIDKLHQLKSEVDSSIAVGTTLYDKLQRLDVVEDTHVLHTHQLILSIIDEISATLNGVRCTIGNPADLNIRGQNLVECVNNVSTNVQDTVRSEVTAQTESMREYIKSIVVE